LRIGGGIILHQYCCFFHTGLIKQNSHKCCIYFRNLVAGLSGMLTQFRSMQTWYLYIAIAFSGGLLGAYFAKSNQNVLKYVLASVLLVASQINRNEA
jgi:hypothetical protein